MRDDNKTQGTMYSYVDMEARVPQSRPIRNIRRVVDKALKAMGPDSGQLYSNYGWTSIVPDKLLKVQILQILRSIRSERQLLDRIDHDLPFGWLVGLTIDVPIWKHSIFEKSRLMVECRKYPKLLDQIRIQVHS